MPILERARRRLPRRPARGRRPLPVTIQFRPERLDLKALRHSVLFAEWEISSHSGQLCGEVAQTWVAFCELLGVRLKYVREDGPRAMPGIPSLTRQLTRSPSGRPASCTGQYLPQTSRRTPPPRHTALTTDLGGDC